MSRPAAAIIGAIDESAAVRAARDLYAIMGYRLLPPRLRRRKGDRRAYAVMLIWRAADGTRATLQVPIPPSLWKDQS